MGKFNIAAEILERARLRGTHPALVGRDGEVTYGELAARVEKMAARLTAGPVFLRAEVPRIGVTAREGVEHVVAMLGVMVAGGCAVPVPREFSERERGELRTLTGLQGLLTNDVEWLEEMAPGFPVAEFNALHPAMVRFSSGTTGQSKGVVLSHQTIRERVESANRRLQITESDRVLWTLPMAHHFAVSILLYLREGATIVLPDGSLAGDLLAAAKEHGATIFYGSPFQARLLAADRSGKDWASLRLAVSTTAPLPGRTAQEFAQRFGLPLRQALGIIEAGLPLVNSSDGAVASVGREDDFSVKIDGEPGELCLRGPGMFDAYLSPWITREQVMADGWFHTGDLARREGNGSITIVGRLKSVINVGGSKCFPEEIESVLLAHPAVKAARVHGELHENWGMVPVAEVVTEPTRPVGPADLLNHARRHLAAYKVPSRVVLVESLPLTASGKLVRT